MKSTCDLKNKSTDVMSIVKWLLAAAIILSLGFASQTAGADQRRGNFKWETVPFSVANIYFELNDTDGDLGIHALIDGEPWRYLAIKDPNRRKMLGIYVQRRLQRQGLTELFFESAEPSFDELEPSEFFKRFPEGVYEISGYSLERQWLRSTSELTHVLAAPPENIMISGLPAAEDCDSYPLPQASEPVIITWDPVMESHPEIGRAGEPVEVVKYQVVVQEEESESTLSVDLPPDVTQFQVPSEFTALGEAFKLEILVKESSGNQTAVETCFEIE